MTTTPHADRLLAKVKAHDAVVGITGMRSVGLPLVLAFVSSSARETRPGRATVALEHGTTTLIVKGLPAEVCANSGEECVPDEAAQRCF